MQPQRHVGLQWKLASNQVLTAAAGTLSVALGFLLLRQVGLPEGGAIAIGLAIGVVVALAGASLTFRQARSIKLRLWEAGDLAGRITRGDFKGRLTPNSTDELGWLEEQLNAMARHLESAVAELEAMAEQNRRLAEEAGRGAALEERTRLARDLHDTVNQQLFALSMGVAAARRRLERLDAIPHESTAELAELEQMARDAHGQIRELILQLRPTSLEQHGLGPALLEYANRAADKEGWRLEAEINTPGTFEPAVRDNLFRLAQEALANISKHADAHRVVVSLNMENDQITLKVGDDGVGFDPKRLPRPTAVGLVGMRERIQSIGGMLTVESDPGKGTTVTATVPDSSTPGKETF